MKLLNHVDRRRNGFDDFLVFAVCAGLAARRGGFDGGGAALASGLAVGASFVAAVVVPADAIGIDAAAGGAKKGWLGWHGRQYPATVTAPERSHIAMPVSPDQTGQGPAGGAAGPCGMESASRCIGSCVDGMATDSFEFVVYVNTACLSMALKQNTAARTHYGT